MLLAVAEFELLIETTVLVLILKSSKGCHNVPGGGGMICLHGRLGFSHYAGEDIDC